MVDDLSIANDDLLFRRVRRNQLVPMDDGSWRPSSAVFEHLQLSVNIQSLMTILGRKPADLVPHQTGDFLLSFEAGGARGLGQRVVKDQGPGHDPDHGLVVGKKTESVKKSLRKQCTWVIAPTDV